MQDQIDDFIQFIAVERGLSDAYQMMVRRSLEVFSKWMGSQRQKTHPEQINIDDIGEYLQYRKKHGLVAGSLKLIVVALRIWLRFLHGRGAVPKDVGEFLHLPRLERYLPETLNELKMEKLVECISENSRDPFDLRARAMLELMYASGLRVTEVATVRLENLDLEEGMIRVLGKGKKVRIIPVGRRALDALKNYLRFARTEFVKAGTSSEIFLSRRGRKLTRRRIAQIVAEVAKRAGLDENVYPHLLRHSFATHLLSNGADLRVIQELLGHSDIGTTQVYTHVDQRRLKSVHHQFHPRA